MSDSVKTKSKNQAPEDGLTQHLMMSPRDFSAISVDTHN